jgi:hypothetical protein
MAGSSDGTFVNIIIILQVPIKMGEFIYQLREHSLLKNDSVPGSLSVCSDI